MAERDDVTDAEARATRALAVAVAAAAMVDDHDVIGTLTEQAKASWPTGRASTWRGGVRPPGGDGR